MHKSDIFVVIQHPWDKLDQSCNLRTIFEIIEEKHKSSFRCLLRNHHIGATDAIASLGFGTMTRLSARIATEVLLKKSETLADP